MLKNKSAEITVFASLVFLIIISFIFTIIHGTYESATRLRIETVTDISIRSAFFEYNKMLYKKYGLLYIDTTYKGFISGGNDSFMSHVSQYIDVNIEASSSDIYGIELVSADLEDAVYAADDNYRSVRNQIRNYMTISEKYSVNLSDEELLYKYIDSKMPGDFYDMYFNGTDNNHLSSYVEYDELFNCVIEEINRDMIENYDNKFSLSNHLEEGVITAYVRDKNNKTYECRRHYSIR